jgi:hypothetical protein
MKGLSAAAMQGELVDVLEPHAIAYSAVAKCFRSTSSEVKDAGSDKGRGDGGINLTNHQILHTLEMSPLDQVARLFGQGSDRKQACIGTLRNRSTLPTKNRVGFPAASDRGETNAGSKINSLDPNSMKHHFRQYIVTLDESSFCL